MMRMYMRGTTKEIDYLKSIDIITAIASGMYVYSNIHISGGL